MVSGGKQKDEKETAEEKVKEKTKQKTENTKQERGKKVRKQGRVGKRKPGFSTSLFSLFVGYSLPGENLKHLLRFYIRALNSL